MVRPLDLLELAWAAGFYDGEGCTHVSVHGRLPTSPQYGYMHLAVAQSGPAAKEVLERFRNAVGGLGSVLPMKRRNPKWQEAYTWRVDSREAAQAVVAMLWRFLGPVKRAQAVAVASRIRELEYKRLAGSPFADRHPECSLSVLPLSAPEPPLDLLELAWAAGFYDGEGSTHVARAAKTSPPRGYVNLDVWQAGTAERAVLERFQRAVGGLGRMFPATRRRENPAEQSCYVWRATVHEEVQAVLARLWRFLGPVKRAQAVRAIAEVAEMDAQRPPSRRRRVDQCPSGHPRSAENRYVDKRGWSHCIPCAQATSLERNRAYRARKRARQQEAG